MKEKEEAAISEAIRMLNYTLEVDKDAGDNRITLDPGTRRAYDQARIGLEDIFQAQEAKLKARANRITQLREASKDLNVQQTFFDEKGRAKGLDDSGRMIPTERSDKELDALTKNGGVNPDQGTQGQLSDLQHANTPDRWKVPRVAPEVPANVREGLIQALSDGSGRKKACETVGEAIGMALFTVEEHFDALVKRGLIVKKGKHWVAGEAPPEPPNSDDPDVLATSETPSEPLVTTTEAEAQAA